MEFSETTTMLILSSAEYCRRVALRMSLTAFSAQSGLASAMAFSDCKIITV
jgi:hypothetical protein